jgi:diguanylate cyclase (GGDEF)-like protein
LALSFLVPWRRIPRQARLVFPVLVWVAIASLGLAADGVGANFLGTFVLSFLYIGLTQRSGTGAVLAPFAAVGYVGAYGTWSTEIVPRVIIATAVYVLVAEVLAALQTQHRDMTRQLRRSAHTDALTGLPNRRDLDLRLTTTSAGDLVAICDLDYFKRVNDTFGHATCDRVLADFGLLLRAVLRDGDYAARLGGEEFAIVLKATRSSDAKIVMERLRTRWRILWPDITFSSGSAVCRDDRAVSNTLEAADQALYEAKAAGRNRDVAELARASV